MNEMHKIRIEKLTLNIGAGKDQGKLEKGIKLLKHLTGIAPVKTHAKKRLPAWGLRPGLPIGCKLTIRNGQKKDLIGKFLAAKDNKLDKSCFDDNGSLSFGIHEYIDIPEVQYNPDIGIMGFQVCITLSRPGFRIKKRRLKRKSLPGRVKITKEEAIEFFRKEFNLSVGE
jgi:large subunit ribosomal protein L5